MCSRRYPTQNKLNSIFLHFLAYIVLFRVFCFVLFVLTVLCLLIMVSDFVVFKGVVFMSVFFMGFFLILVCSCFWFFVCVFVFLIACFIKREK